MKKQTLRVFVSIFCVSLFISECRANRQIPMGMSKKMTNMRSTENFIHEMVVPRQSKDASLKPNERDIYSGTRTEQIFTLNMYTGTFSFNSQAVSIMANQIATPDVCEPRPMTVPIPPDSDPMVIYWPMCTKLEQCGGCCGHDLLECAPISTETVVVQVMKQKVSAEDPNKFDYLGNVDIPLQRHLACECGCKVKAADCNAAIQDYDSVNCLCRCKNSVDATSCQLPKRWDDQRCRCTCPTITSCLDNESFDFNTCSCVPTPAQSGAAPLMASTDPCHSSPLRCRAGMKKTKVGNQCQCRSM